MSIEFVTESGLFPFCCIAETIQVEVSYLHSMHLIAFDQGVSRALHAPGMPQRLQQRTYERGLAGTQIAAQIDDESRSERLCEMMCKGDGGRLIAQCYWAMMRLMQNETPPLDYSGLAARIRQWAGELGFQAVGISGTDLGEAEAHLLRWLAEGRHGEMDYMAKHGVIRARPAELLPGTLRVISLCMNYYPMYAREAAEVLADGRAGFISRYALGRDYHKVVRNRLAQLVRRICAEEPAAQCRVFTDSAPVLEVELAQRTQLGWRGKHTLLLSRERGSYFFLGEIFINLPLPADEPVSSHCGSCVACIEACPTRAITAPYQLDARRCISYLTIELKGSIPPALRPLIGNRIYGCDDCQIVCPWNRFARISLEPDFRVRHALDDASLLELFAWDEIEFRRRFEGSAIYRIGHEQWLRNIAVALGNAPTSPDIVRALHTHISDPSALVREHVGWALERHSVKKSQ